MTDAKLTVVIVDDHSIFRSGLRADLDDALEGLGEAATVEEAVDRMELVGHDFFLFVDARTDHPSVVYRRKGWDYGVIALSAQAPPAEALAS